MSSDDIDNALGSIANRAPGSRIGKEKVEQPVARQATRTTEKTIVYSVRLPEAFAAHTRQIAKQFGISEAEAKRAIIYRGVQAYMIDKEQLETEFTTKVVAVRPSDLA
jgi:hypothetical protein